MALYSFGSIGGSSVDACPSVTVMDLSSRGPAGRIDHIAVDLRREALSGFAADGRHRSLS